MRTVRTTMRPDLDVEVDDADYLDLERQGLLITEGSQSAAAPASATQKKTAAAPTASGTTKEG